MRAFRATMLFARVSIIALVSALAHSHARAHTVSIGYAFAGPGSVNIWYGSYHASSTFNEADVRLVGPSYNQTIAFSLLANVKPAGLVDGTTNFYSNTAGTMLVGIPEPVASTDGSGGSFDPATQSILHWQGATFSGLAPGTYTFTYNPLAQPTVEWHPINDVIRTNSFTLTMADVLGISGFTPYANTQNQKSVARGIDASINGGAFNQAFYDIASQQPAQMQNSFTQMSGEPLTQVGQAGFQSMNAFLAAMLDPFSGAGSADARGGDFAGGMPGDFAPGGDPSLFGGAPYGGSPYGASPYGGSIYGSSPYGSSPYSSSPYGSAPYGNSPYGSSPYGSSPYGNSAYGNSPYGNSPYGNSPYANSPYGNSPYGNSQNANASAAGANGERGAARGIDATCLTADGRVQPCWSVWVTPYGAHSSLSGNSLVGSHDTTVKSGGLISGIDHRFAPGGTVGAAIAAGTTTWGLSDSLGGGRSDSFQIGAYASQRFNTAYISAALAYGWQQVSTDRTVTVSGNDRLGADFTAHGFGGRAEAGNRFDYNGTGLTPYVAAQIQTWRLPAYTEAALSGSNNFAVAVDARNANDTRVEAGLWADRAFSTLYGVLQMRGRMAWLYNMQSSALINGVFPAMPGSNFITTGATVDPNALLISYGAELRLASNWSAGAKFDGELSRLVQTYSGTGTIRYRW